MGKVAYVLMGDYGAYENRYQAVVGVFTSKREAIRQKERLEAAVKAGPWVDVNASLVHGHFTWERRCEAAQHVDRRACEVCSYEIETVPLDDLVAHGDE